MIIKWDHYKQNVNLGSLTQGLVHVGAKVTFQLKVKHIMEVRLQEIWGGGYFHTWRWYGASPWLTPVFDIFWSPFGPHFMDRLDPIDLFLQKIICLFLSHLVPKIIGLNIFPIFQQNLSFYSFESLCTKFLPDFRSCWPLFPLFIDLFDLFWQNLRYDWVNYFLSHAGSLYQTFGEVPPPPFSLGWEPPPR